MAAVVADASVLIALSRIDQLALLQKLFDRLVIPPAVAREVQPRLSPFPAWIETRTLHPPLDPRVSAAMLQAGETEAIALALQLDAERVILDDLRARRLARELRLAVVGTAGVVLAAKQRGLIVAVRPMLDALRAASFRLRDDVYDELLKAAGEGEHEPE